MDTLPVSTVLKTDTHYFDYGGFSEVYRGIFKDPSTGVEHPVAIKALRGIHTLNAADYDHFLIRLDREARVWRSLNHVNILPFFGVCDDRVLSPGPVLISPLCTEGTALAFVQKYPDTNRRHMLSGIAQGLEYLHSHDVIHGDLKPSNVLVNSDGIPQLCDFGRSRILDQRGFTTRLVGTQRYMAPELLDQNDEDEENSSLDLTKMSDVYGFAMIGLEIVTGLSPFYYIKNDMFIPLKVTKGERPRWERYSLPADSHIAERSIIEACWKHDARARPEMARVVEQLVFLDAAN